MKHRFSSVLLAAYLVFMVATGFIAGAQEQMPTSVQVVQAIKERDEVDRWIERAERIGICLVGLILMGYLIYRQKGLEDMTAKLEGVVDRYDETQQAHLAAFKDITANYRQLAEDNRDLAVSCAGLNTRVAEKVEQLTVAVKELKG